MKKRMKPEAAFMLGKFEGNVKKMFFIPIEEFEYRGEKWVLHLDTLNLFKVTHKETGFAACSGKRTMCECILHFKDVLDKTPDQKLFSALSLARIELEKVGPTT